VRQILSLILPILLLASGCSGERGSAPDDTGSASQEGSSTVTINASSGELVEVRVEIADNFIEREKGLMGRTALAEDAGMLFVFDSEQPLSFWMKDTLIPLSIAYMDGEGRIVDIQDMQPLDETEHPSAKPAEYALEVNQGFFAERGVKVGDKAELPNV
jgi:uncharacterized membrane protein (UPF0127 family)